VQRAFVSCQTAHLLSVYCHLSYWEKKRVGDDCVRLRGKQSTFIGLDKCEENDCV